MSDTKITYDISDAISKLTSLNKHLGKVGENTQKQLGDLATDALDKFEGGLSDVSETAGKVFGKMRALGGALGPMGVAGGVAAAAIASLAANLINLPDILADNRAGMDAFTEAVERNVAIDRQFGDIGDAAAKQAFDRQKAEAALTQTKANANRVELAGQKSYLKAKLDGVADAIDKEEKLYKDSVQRMKTIKERLTEGQNTATVGDVERSAGTKGGAVGDLASRAKQEAMKGNLDLAEQLRDRAQELAEELGGHVFYQKQVDSATQAITGSMETQVSKEQAIQKAALDRAKAASKTADEYQRQLDIVNQLDDKAKKEVKLSRAQMRGARFTEDERQKQDTADEAAGVLSGIQAILRREFEAGGMSVGTNIRKSLEQSFGKVMGGSRQQNAGTEAAQKAFDAAAKIADMVVKKDITPRQVQEELGPAVKELSSQLGALEIAQKSGTVKGFEPIIEQLKSILNQGLKVGKVGEDVVNAGRSQDDPIAVGMKSINADLAREMIGVQNRMEGLEAALGRNTTAVEKSKTTTPGTTAPAAAMKQAQAAQSPVGAAVAAVSNVVVNATVRGGIIDAETTRTITDIIRSELRKQTISKTK